MFFNVFLSKFDSFIFKITPYFLLLSLVLSENCEFSDMKYSHIAILAVLWCFSGAVLGQTHKEKSKALDNEARDFMVTQATDFVPPDTSITMGHFTKALGISFIPDASTIGVYLLIDEDYKYTVDELVLPTKSYFDHYNLPVILVKQEKPLKGNGARMKIYIGGECLDGDLETGDLSLYELQQNHEKWFAEIKALYFKAQE